MPHETRVSTDGPEVHIEGHDVVLTNSMFPISPVWDALCALYGDPYKPILGIDSLRAAQAITNPQDPVWAEVFELFGDSHAVEPSATLEAPEVPAPWVDTDDRLAAPPLPENPDEEFYEDDEPIAELLAAFTAGQREATEKPTEETTEETAEEATDETAATDATDEPSTAELAAPRGEG